MKTKKKTTTTDAPVTTATTTPTTETAAPVVELPTITVAHLDRRDLRATLTEFKALGLDVAWSKEDDDTTLAAKVRAALVPLHTPKVLKLLASIDQTKVVNAAAQPDCLGLWIDTRTVACQACPDATACLKAYAANLKSDFAPFVAAMAEIKVEEQAAAVPAAAVAAAVKKAETAPPAAPKTKTITYEPTRRIYVMDLPNPLDAEDMSFETIDAILDEVPGTARELREIVERTFTINDEKLFPIEWLGGLRDLGLLKFAHDLTEEERAALTEAGVDVTEYETPAPPVEEKKKKSKKPTA